MNDTFRRAEVIAAAMAMTLALAMGRERPEAGRTDKASLEILKAVK